MKWWEWMFDGVGGVAGVSVVGFILGKCLMKDKTAINQSVKAGNGSRNVQAGRDVHGLTVDDDD
jgi:hypothetical protein